eukprot:12903415-Prorocentrum_lima.AAC.1
MECDSHEWTFRITGHFLFNDIVTVTETVKSPSPKLSSVTGVNMKRAFVATTRDAAIAHVFTRHTMLPAEF